MISAMVSASGLLGFVSSAKAGQKVEKFNFISQKYSVVVTDSSVYNLSTRTVVANQNSNGKTFSNCNFQALFSGQNYFQDQALLNLNQPANCFNLGLSEFPPVVKNLEVKNLSYPITKVVVVEFPSSLYAQNLRQGPSADSGLIAVFVNYSFVSFFKKYALVKPNVNSALQRVETNNYLIINSSSLELQNLLC